MHLCMFYVLNGRTPLSCLNYYLRCTYEHILEQSRQQQRDLNLFTTFKIREYYWLKTTTDKVRLYT